MLGEEDKLKEEEIKFSGASGSIVKDGAEARAARGGMDAASIPITPFGALWHCPVGKMSHQNCWVLGSTGNLLRGEGDGFMGLITNLPLIHRGPLGTQPLGTSPEAVKPH